MQLCSCALKKDEVKNSLAGTFTRTTGWVKTRAADREQPNNSQRSKGWAGHLKFFTLPHLENTDLLLLKMQDNWHAITGLFHYKQNARQLPFNHWVIPL